MDLPPPQQVLPPWVEAVAQVGVAGVGAVVVVGETVVTATRQVVVTAADVAADVVEHAYGATAGQSVRDCSETVGNLWLTMQSGLTLVSPLAWTRVVARHGCKQHLRQTQSGQAPTTGMEAPKLETAALLDRSHFL
jgi:hypothetical protein